LIKIIENDKSRKYSCGRDDSGGKHCLNGREVIFIGAARLRRMFLSAPTPTKRPLCRPPVSTFSFLIKPERAASQRVTQREQSTRCNEAAGRVLFTIPRGEIRNRGHG